MTGSTTSGPQPFSRMARATSRTSAASASMPVLSAAGGRSSASAVSCSVDHVFGDALDCANLPGILGGQGDDHRSPENAELLEGFQVRLDPGAAAGIRSGNGEGDLHRVSTGMSSSLQTLIRDLHRRRGRERRGLALAEGVRLVEEALAGGIAIRGAAVSATLESTTRGTPSRRRWPAAASEWKTSARLSWRPWPIPSIPRASSR